MHTRGMDRPRSVQAAATGIGPQLAQIDAIGVGGPQLPPAEARSSFSSQACSASCCPNTERQNYFASATKPRSARPSTATSNGRSKRTHRRNSPS